MAKKYYAVQQGRKPGIYETWADCEAQVKGFSGAVYKSFPTKTAAEAFLNPPAPGATYSLAEAIELGVLPVESKPQSTNEKTDSVRPVSGADGGNHEIGAQSLVAYIDGSFDKRSGAVGSGGIIFYNNESWEFSFGTKDSFYTEYWNVSGELLGAMHVLKEARKCGAQEVHLYYDYMGIEMWALGRWKTNNPLTQYYAKFVKDYLPTMAIHFHKVAAHTGVEYNERADQLAKAGTTKC